MASEIRHVLFRPAEVVQAVAEYHKRMQQPLPSGSILSCRTECKDPGGVVRFVMTLVPDERGRKGHDKASPAPIEVAVEGPALAAALIVHCQTLRIPLPAKADKSLQLFGDRICLIATINPKNDEIPEGARL